MNERFCSLTFDDSKKNHTTVVAPFLQKVSIPATFYVIAKQKRDWTFWKDAAKMGFEIGSHSGSHRLLSFSPYKNKRPLASKRKIKDQIVSSQNIIQNYIGKKCMSFAYPFGYACKYARNIVKKYYNTGRGATFTNVLKPEMWHVQGVNLGCRSDRANLRCIPGEKRAISKVLLQSHFRKSFFWTPSWLIINWHNVYNVNALKYFIQLLLGYDFKFGTVNGIYNTLKKSNFWDK